MTKEQKRTLAAYKQVFTSTDGKLVLDDLRVAFGDRPSYQKGDAYHTAYNEGGRALYLRICAAIEEAIQAERVSNGRKRIRPESIGSDSDEYDSDNPDNGDDE